MRKNMEKRSVVRGMSENKEQKLGTLAAASVLNLSSLRHGILVTKTGNVVLSTQGFDRKLGSYV